jgi:hypothetical protein
MSLNKYLDYRIFSSADSPAGPRARLGLGRGHSARKVFVGPFFSQARNDR